MAQVGLALATQLLLVLLVRQAYGLRVARTTAWLYAFDPSLIAYTHYLRPETLYLFLLLAAVSGLLSCRRGLAEAAPAASPLRSAAVAGAFFGLATLVKTVPLGFVATFVIPWLLTAGASKGRAAAAVLVLTASLGAVIAPWSLYNSWKYQRFFLVDLTQGINLRYGQNPLLPPSWDDYGPLPPLGIAVRPCVDANLVDRSSCESAKALSFLVGNPGLTLRRAWIKMADFWSPTSYLIGCL